MKRPSFPHKVNPPTGSNHRPLFIYETPTKGYESYTLAYNLDGQRKRETSSDWMALIARAKEVLADLADGRQLQTGTLKAGEREEFVRAKAELAKMAVITKSPPPPLDVVVRRYVESVKIIGDELVIEVAKEHARRHPAKMQKKLVADVVTEFLAEKEKRLQAGKLSARHLETLKSHCQRFSGKVSMNIGSVTAADIDLFLDGLNVGPRTRDNITNSLGTMFAFAKRKKYLPSDHDEANRVTRMDADEDGPIEIFTVEQMKALLKAADDSLRPFIAIGGFAGLRSSEIQRLDWQDVRFGSNCIVVQKGKVKKRGKSRRVVPMTPNLKSWLLPFSKRTGLVWPLSKPYLYEALAAVAVKAKVQWKSNALRHSYVSYRIAATKNVPATAYESGNSPQIIASNYHELVTEKDAAKRWFGIKP